MRIRVEDAKCIIVMLFDEGHPASEVAEILELPLPFVKKAIKEWWQLMGDREWENEQREQWNI